MVLKGKSREYKFVCNIKNREYWTKLLNLEKMTLAIRNYLNKNSKIQTLLYIYTGIIMKNKGKRIKKKRKNIIYVCILIIDMILLTF